MPHITRHLLVPEARQADAHECPAGAGGRHGPRGGSEPSRLAPRAQTRTQGRRGGLVHAPRRTVWGHVADASRGAVPGVRSSWAWATATGHTNGPPTLGVRLVLVARTCLGRGVNYVTMRTPDAPCGARSCHTRTGTARGGILMGAGGSHRPCSCPTPARRARRARKRAWAGWASVRSPPAHREERAGVQ